MAKLKIHKCEVNSPGKLSAFLKVTWACMEDSVHPKRGPVSLPLPHKFLLLLLSPWGPSHAAVSI